MINPFFIFILAFLSVGIMYTFNFSLIYPTLSFSVVFFFVVAFLLMGLIGYWVSKKQMITFKKVKSNPQMILFISVAVVFIVLVEGVYSHGLPLTNMLLGRDSGYADFGIPTVHVIVMTFNAFLATYVFHLLLSNFSKFYLGIFFLNLIPNLLVVNRGMLAMLFMNFIWIFLIYLGKNIKLRHILALIPIGFLGLYAFGVMGNMRLNASYQTGRTAFDTTTFMEIGKATPEFRQSAIPKEFFWSYIYLTSPVANLQKNIDHQQQEKYTGTREVNGFVFNELIPEFIGKRITGPNHYEGRDPLQVTPELTAVSAFTGSYKWLGWVGMLLYLLYMTFFALLYIVVLKLLSPHFFVSGIAILNSIFLFSFFANMLAFTGLVFQLVYPIVLGVWNSYCDDKGYHKLKI